MLSDLFVLSLSFLLLQSLQQKVSKLLPPATLQFERRLFKCVLLLTQRFSNLLCADNFGDLWNLLNLWMDDKSTCTAGWHSFSNSKRLSTVVVYVCYTVLHSATQCYTVLHSASVLQLQLQVSLASFLFINFSSSFSFPFYRSID